MKQEVAEQILSAAKSVGVTAFSTSTKTPRMKNPTPSVSLVGECALALVILEISDGMSPKDRTSWFSCLKKMRCDASGNGYHTYY